MTGPVRRRADGGNAIVEFALWFPLVLLALTAALQLMGAVYDDRAAQDAARVGLRAQQAGADPARAARAALAARGDSAVVTAEGGTVRVELPVRRFLPWLPTAVRTVSATAGEPAGRP